MLIMLLILLVLSMILAPLVGGLMAMAVTMSRLFGWVGRLAAAGKRLFVPLKQ